MNKRMNNFDNQFQEINKNLEIAMQNQQKINSLETKVNNINNYIANPIEDNRLIGKSHNIVEEYLRKGNEMAIEKKSFSTDGDEGSVITSPELDRKIHSLIFAKSPMRNIASVQTTSNGAFDYILEDNQMQSGWIGEKEVRNVTDTSQLKKKRILVHELYAQPKATQRLLDDAELNFDNWIAERLADSFASKENIAFFSGDGDKKPNGILGCAEIKKIESPLEFTPNIFLQLINDLSEEYIQNATFVMNRSTLSKIQAMKDKDDRFIWQQSLTDPLKNTIFGIPVVCATEMPNVEDNNCAVAIGDFRAGYKIIDRSNIMIMRDPYTDKPFVKFYAVKRVGGDVVNPKAIRFAEFKS